MSVIPCRRNDELKEKINEFAELLKEKAHTIEGHGLSEAEFYNSGLFRGAIERIRGQFSATMKLKREFVQHILNHLQDEGHIGEWHSAGEDNRHDYSVQLNSGRQAVIELKGCLDGNNTTIYERPPHAEEFIIWSVCTNAAADPQHNAWSGIHTRLSADIISRKQVVDGIIIWDMVCGTIDRICPKVESQIERLHKVGPYSLPPPCLYLMPPTIPSPRNNPTPKAQQLQNVELLQAFSDCFMCESEEISYIDFEVVYKGSDTARKTTVRRNNIVEKESGFTAIKRT